MNVVIGYLQDGGDFGKLSEQLSQLRSMGAQVVRVEEGIDQGGLLKPCLNAICNFIGPGDELLVPDLRHLGETVDAVLATVRRIESRGATLRLLESEASTRDDGGKAIIHELEQLERTGEHCAKAGGRQETDETDVNAILALRAHGFGPSQIARKLGVSRMTVWRRLSSLQDAS